MSGSAQSNPANEQKVDKEKNNKTGKTDEKDNKKVKANEKDIKTVLANENDNNVVKVDQKDNKTTKAEEKPEDKTSLKKENGETKRKDRQKGSITKSEKDSVIIKVKAVKTEEEFDSILKKSGDTLIVVDFYATWCAPCKMAAPQLDRMAGVYKDVTFLKVDVDDLEPVSNRYEVSTLPTFVFIKQGKVLETLVGSNMEKVEDGVKRHKSAAENKVGSVIQKKEAPSLK